MLERGASGASRVAAQSQPRRSPCSRSSSRERRAAAVRLERRRPPRAPTQARPRRPRCPAATRRGSVEERRPVACPLRAASRSRCSTRRVPLRRLGVALPDLRPMRPLRRPSCPATRDLALVGIDAELAPADSSTEGGPLRRVDEPRGSRRVVEPPQHVCGRGPARAGVEERRAERARFRSSSTAALPARDAGRRSSASCVGLSSATSMPEAALLVDAGSRDRPVAAVGLREERRGTAAPRAACSVASGPPRPARMSSRAYAGQVDDRVRLGSRARHGDRPSSDAPEPDGRARTRSRVVVAERRGRAAGRAATATIGSHSLGLVRPEERDRRGLGRPCRTPPRRRARATSASRTVPSPQPSRCRRPRRPLLGERGCRSLRRSEPSGFLPRSLSHLTLTLARRTPAVTKGGC